MRRIIAITTVVVAPLLLTFCSDSDNDVVNSGVSRRLAATRRRRLRDGRAGPSG